MVARTETGDIVEVLCISCVVASGRVMNDCVMEAFGRRGGREGWLMAVGAVRVAG